MTREKQKRALEDANIDSELAEQIAQEVLGRVRSMIKWNDESAKYYEGVRNKSLRSNKMYFRGMRDGQEDAKRVLRACIFEVLTRQEMKGVLAE